MTGAIFWERRPARTRHSPQGACRRGVHDRGHLEADRSRDDHQVALARAGAEDFGAEAGEIEAGSGHGHHLNGAAGETETEWPDGALAGPVHGFIELREDDAFVLKELAEIVGLGESDAFGESGFHGYLFDAHLF